MGLMTDAAAMPLVLVVDDDAPTRLMLCHALARDGYRAEAAANGREALECFARLKPDLVLLDALMPEMDGFETCRRLKQHGDGVNTPVLMITSLNDELSVERAYALGAEDFLTKPIHWPVLRARVRRVLGAARAAHRLRRLAYHDPLTGLANRAQLLERLEMLVIEATRNARRFAVLFLDLDRFKQINDSLGHAVGDAMLQELGQRLGRELREGDAVGRFGGDEFVILLERLRQAADAERVAAKLLETMREPLQLADRTLLVTASIGIAVYPDHGTDMGWLLQHADTAVYAAKRAGGNRSVFYEPHMSAAASRRLELENALREALPHNQIEVHYQPLVNLADGVVYGVEALARWRHPQFGMVSPAEFIPLAEEIGLIGPLGEHVLHTACHALRGAPGLNVAVNVSPLQLHHAAFPAVLARVLEETAFPGERLTLEITENAVMAQPEAAASALRAVKALGARIAIDDFGTGHSSLSYLKQFPIDTLKIDRSFVADLPHSSDGAAIASAIIGLAHNLGRRVVAEGVEHAEQEEFLRDRGCDAAQGYRYGRPVPAAELFCGLAAPRRDCLGVS